MNEHLLTAPDNDRGTSVKIDMSGFEFFSGTSGHVPPGNYKLKIKDARWKNKKSGVGKNLSLQLIITAPNAHSGVQIIENPPAPAGKDEDTAVRTGASKLCAIVGSIATGQGEEVLESVKKKGLNTVGPKWLIGKTVFATLRDDDYEGRPYSSVADYISKDDFNANPAPLSRSSSSSDVISTAEISQTLKEMKSKTGDVEAPELIAPKEEQPPVAEIDEADIPF
jgi:hypothetical protein